ncbi:Transposable element Tc3 transposase, partial [Clarias magur]
AGAERKDSKHTGNTTMDFIRRKKQKVLDWPRQSTDIFSTHLKSEGKSLNKQLKEAGVQFGDIIAPAQFLELQSQFHSDLGPTM